MSWHQEIDELVWDGFDKGIADSPYLGLGDMRNANIISTPGEAEVNFATTLNSFGAFSGSVASASAGSDTVTYTGETGTPIAGMALVFTGASLPSGISAATLYWIGNVDTGAKTFKVYTDVGTTALVDILGTGTGTFVTTDIGTPKHQAVANTPGTSNVLARFILDANGRAWTDQYGTGLFRFLGNTTLTNANGNGMVWYAGYSPAGNGYLFVFRNSLIDYYNLTAGTWTYGWKTMNTAAGINNSHHSLVGQDNTVYYCDGSFLGSFFQTTVSTPFDPTGSTTYTYASQALRLPSIETSTWLAELGVTLLVGGVRNYIYPWDRTSTSFNFPILLAENNTQRMVTINTNTYCFTGDRGRVYMTNGTNAKLAFKMPDHISGTEDPIFTWGAAGFNKNQLYFGALVTTNSGGALSKYGGLWAVDLATNALRLVNILSYGTYAGYATVFIPLSGTGNGTGFYVGWNSGASTYGVDVSSGNPYTNYETYIESDMIPVGTYLKKRTFETFEWKVSRPLVTGENIRMSMRNDLTTAFTVIGTTTSADTGQVQGYFAGTPQEKNLWLQLKVELQSTTSSPSYVRLTQIRARAQATEVIGTPSTI